MGLRFRRSIKLAPGIRMNVSGGGVSWTLGPRGASIGIGKRGSYLNTGIPGTGLSSRERIGGSTASREKTVHMSIQIEVTDEGEVIYKDDNGNMLSETIIKAVKKQKGDVVLELIQKKCDEINNQTESLGEIHAHTPQPNIKPQYQPLAYPESSPAQPKLKKPGIMGALFKSWKSRIERDNQQQTSIYQNQLKAWQKDKHLFDITEHARQAMIEKGIYTEVKAMEMFLEENLQAIVWPRETDLSCDIIDEGKKLLIDVDLPEIDDMPTKIASVPQRGYKLNIKDMTATQIQRLYMRHVHGVGFRIIGEAFSALPNLQQVVLSAFSQRPGRTTGHTADEYLYSVRVDRNAWLGINFHNLKDLDIVHSFEQFELVRNMTKTGVFKPIQPLGQG